MTNEMFESKLLELVELLRSIRRAFPNGYKALSYEALRLFDELINPPNIED